MNRFSLLRPVRNKTESGVRFDYFLLISAFFAAALHYSPAPVERLLLCEKLIPGLLPLIGFLVAARSFLVVELHKNVYGTEAYREQWARVKSVAGASDSTHDPLLKFDKHVGRCLLNSIACVILTWVVAMIRNPGAPFTWWQMLVGDLALGATLGLAFCLLLCVDAMNRNFSALIRCMGSLNQSDSH